MAVKQKELSRTKVRDRRGFKEVITSSDLWLGVYFFVVFQLALYFIGQGGLADNPTGWTLGGLGLGFYAIIHGLYFIRNRLDRGIGGPYELPLMRRVLLTVFVLYLFIYAVSYALLFLGVVPTVQPNQESVNAIMAVQKIPMVFMTLLVAPIIEELVFRELLPAAGGYSKVSFILSSILFVILHQPSGLSGWLVYGGVSCAFLYLRLKGNNVMQSMYGHVIYNTLSSVF